MNGKNSLEILRISCSTIGVWVYISEHKSMLTSTNAGQKLSQNLLNILVSVCVHVCMCEPVCKCMPMGHRGQRRMAGVLLCLETGLLLNLRLD